MWGRVTAARPLTATFKASSGDRTATMVRMPTTSAETAAPRINSRPIEA